MKKIVLCTILILIILNAFCILKFEANAMNLTGMENQVTNWLTTGRDRAGTELGNGINEITSPLVNIGQILLMIATGVLVIVTTFMGIKYITASPEGQAKLKQQLVGLVVSCIVIFGAWSIWRMTILIASRITGGI